MKFLSSGKLIGQFEINLEAPIINEVTLGVKSIRYFGPKIWNSFPFHIKSSESLTTFKKIKKNWHAVSCKCPICDRLEYCCYIIIYAA